MTTPLEAANLVLNRHLAKSISNPQFLREAQRLVDDLFNEAAAAALTAAHGTPSQTFVIEYRDLEGERITIRTDPFAGALDSGIERWRQMARIVVEHGGYEVKLHVSTTYHRVEEFGGDQPAPPDPAEVFRAAGQQLGEVARRFRERAQAECVEDDHSAEWFDES